jgi:hypothetical protein
MTDEAVKAKLDLLKPGWEGCVPFINRMARLALNNKSTHLARHFIEMSMDIIKLPEATSLLAELYRLYYEQTRDYEWLKRSADCWKSIADINETLAPTCIEELMKDLAQIPTKGEHESGKTEVPITESGNVVRLRQRPALE